MHLGLLDIAQMDTLPEQILDEITYKLPTQLGYNKTRPGEEQIDIASLRLCEAVRRAAWARANLARRWALSVLSLPAVFI